MRPAASRTPAPDCQVECLAMKLVGELDAGNRHVQFDERGRETECWPSAPSHRARPRLYLRDSLRGTGICLQLGVDRKSRVEGETGAIDPKLKLELSTNIPD